MELIEVLVVSNILFSFLLFLIIAFLVAKIHILDTVLKSLLKQKAAESMSAMMGQTGAVPGMEDSKSSAIKKPNYMG